MLGGEGSRFTLQRIMAAGSARSCSTRERDSVPVRLSCSTGGPLEIEEITSGHTVIGYVIRGSSLPEATTFVTPREANLQVGFVVKGSEEDVPRHDHKPLERSIVGTSEVLVIRKGSGEIEFFDTDRRFVSKHRFSAGDVLVMLTGGHGFRFDSNTVLLEIKQGPYPGVDEKERF